ncbi:organic solute transporter subunit alpha-like [Poecilia reticulata]|uniref:Organic solute transporter subunit alpha-like n=1 Tax=Poecilia reticulata TaxID=8081 RepID=A0A3P9Q6D8_POERE|nr:PREDICTED: organic solute transporter subunit alpha-like [Poecilia reticulata]XP_017163971.1 PREDICTED: organic solute transporter subunit alpha-like [Poecilia reticulata]
MDEDLNVTVDPACLQLEAPLALDMIMQLDTFGLSLYSMLSFMSLLTLLLYLEQCVYIYKKVPYPKKTIIIWISGASPVIATMACYGMWVPRAVMITDMTSNCYFAVVVYKVLVLLIEELGGMRDFLQRFSGKTFRINTGPCCCCCACLPRVSVSRGMLFLMKLGSMQYAILKTVFSVLSVILWMNGTFHVTNLKINSAMIWINPFVGVLLVISIWPIGIVFMNTKILMRSLKIIPKYALYQLTLILSQLQTSIINILALNGRIACAPPLSSYARGAMLSQQILIMEMFIISLFTRSLYRRMYDPLPPEEHDNEQNDKAALKAALEEHDV